MRALLFALLCLTLTTTVARSQNSAPAGQPRFSGAVVSAAATPAAAADDRTFEQNLQSQKLHFNPAEFARIAAEHPPTTAAASPAPVASPIHPDLNVRLRDLHVVRTPAGPAFVIDTPAGPRTVSPNQFAADLYVAQTARRSHGWLFTVLNITTWFGVIWVAVGLLGQVLFTGRMIVQWLVSEKHKRSVVPVAFWWLSLTGASMLVVYFSWRRDIVGIIGQTTGWLIYVRNLWLIYFPHNDHPAGVGVDPAPEPELNQ